MISEIALVIIGPIPDDPEVNEIDKILSPWILTLKNHFKKNPYTRFLGSIPTIAVIPFGWGYIWNLIHKNPTKFYGISLLIMSSDILQYYIGKNFLENIIQFQYLQKKHWKVILAEVYYVLSKHF